LGKVEIEPSPPSKIVAGLIAGLSYLKKNPWNVAFLTGTDK